MQKRVVLGILKILSPILPLFLLLCGAGCDTITNVHLYDQASLNLATQTANTFTNVSFSSGIAAERKLMDSIATTEHNVVQRQTIARRNAAILQIVGQTNAPTSIEVLQSSIDTRISELTALGVDGRSNLLLAINELQNQQGTLASDANIYALNRSSGDPDLPTTCTNADQVASIRSKIVTPVCTNIFDAWVSEWQTVYSLNKEISDSYNNDVGLIGKASQEINQIQSAQNDWQVEYTKRLQAFNDAKKAYDNATTNTGALMAAAETLSNTLSALDMTDAESVMKQLDQLGVNGLGLEGALEQINQERSDVVAAASYISSPNAKAQVPTNSGIFITLLPVIKAAGDTFAHPPTLHLYLAQENLRIKANEIQNEIDIANTLLRLKIQKRQVLTAELMLLTHASLLLTNLNSQTLPGDKLLAQWLPTAKPEEARSTIEALIDFSEAWTSGRVQEELIDYEIIDARQLAALNASDTALQSWNNLISVPLQQLIAFYGSGIKPETIANLISAAGISAAVVAK